MIKTFKIIYLAAILPVLLFSACQKDGEHIMPAIKAINKNFDISGFVLGDTIEQYFDGVKIREYYGQVRVIYSQNQLAFVTDEINMELKSKSTGKTLYRQKFNISDEKNIVPKFYFDGLKFSDRYTYPDAVGNEYKINFYLAIPKNSPKADANMEVLEYYFDDTKPDPIVVVNTTVIPIAANIQPGKWTDYVKIPPVPQLNPTQSGTDFYPIVVLRDSKTKEYLIGKNRDQSTLQVELPDQWTSTGKVQSIYYSRTGTFDLVQLFPR